MRSHFRMLFMVAAAVSIFPSSVAFAESGKSRYLNLEETRKAFGPTFGPATEGESVFLYGISSSSCLKGADGKEPALKVSMNGATGIVTVLYNGTDETCLDFNKMKETLKDSNAQVSLKDGTLTKMSGDFETLQVQSANELNDRAPNRFDELLNEKNEKIAHVSESTRKALAKDAEDKRKGLLSEFYELVLTKCLNQGGATALDESEKALNNLKKISEFMKTKDADWSEAQMAAINKKRFEAAKLIIERGRAADFAQATELLDRVVKQDDSYEPKAKGLYASAVKRLTTSSASNPSDLIAQAEPMLEKLRELAVTDQEDLEINNLERGLYIAQTGRAAKLGADTEEFASMSEKFKSFLVAHDESGCLLSSDEGSPNFGVMDRARIGDPNCRTTLSLAAQFQNQNQMAIMIAHQKAEQAAFQEQVSACASADEAAILGGQKDSSGNPIRSAQCAMVMNRVAEMRKAAEQKNATAPSESGQSSNLTGAGWGTVYSSSDSKNAAKSSGEVSGNGFGTTYSSTDSGLLNTGVGATQESNKIYPQVSQPAPQAVAQPAVNSTGRRVIHR